MKKNAELRRKLLPLLIAGCFGAGQALANPFGAQVINGQVAIASQGNVLTVTNSPGAIINWQSFSIGAGELTKFVQQGASSTVLNRIVGQDPSQILGALQSNGRVLLINPNGILFGQGAQVNVGGLVASTLNISNDDFLAGRMKFQAGDKAADLQNQGNITSGVGGQIYLIAPNVENSGILTSPKGEVVLAAGRSVHLVDSANPDLHVVVSAPDNQAINLGQVVAQSGNVGIYGALIKQRGLVSANSAVVGENGKIVFKASKDTLLEAGSRTTATGAGTGGTIHVLGERVGLTGDAKIDVRGQAGGGTVLVGGDFQGKNVGIPNASQTYFGKDVEIRADAVKQGDGGKVILWADESTRAYGSISARGGRDGGNGGFVETSGKQNLAFDARVDTRAPKGKSGSLLLDPTTLNIVNGGGAPQDDAVNGDGAIFNTEGGAGSAYTVSELALEQLASTTNVTLQATGLITVEDLADNTLAFQQGGGNSVLIQSTSTTGSGIVFADLQDSLTTNGANITLTAAGTGNIDVGKVFSNGGSVSMNAGGTLSVGQISSSSGASAGNINLVSGGLMTLGGSGGINALADAPGDVTLLSGGAINMLNGNYISAFRLKATATGGINDGATGPVHIQASSLNAYNSGSGDIYFYNGGSNLTINDIGSVGYGIKQDASGQNIKVDAGSDLSILAPVTTDNGNIDLWAGLSLSNAATVTASNGYVSLAAYGGNLQNTGNITAGIGSGTLTATAGAINNFGNLTVNNGGNATLDASAGIGHYGTITNNGGNTTLSVSDPEGMIFTDGASQITNSGGYVKLIADKMQLEGGIDATSGYVGLMPTTPSVAIDVGTAVSNDNVATLELANSELNKIKASKLVIGDGASTGTLTIKSGLFGGTGGALENVTELLAFNTNGSITQDSGAIIAAPAVEAVGSDVNLMEANSTGVVSGAASAGDFQYRSSNQITVSYVHVSNGISVDLDKTIRLQSDSNFGINQAGGTILSGGMLVMKTPGSVYLGESNNSVSKVAADLYVGGTGTGSFAMLNYGNLAVDSSIYGISGITTNNKDVEISVPNGFTITENQPINAGVSGVKTLRYDGLLGGVSSTTSTSTTSTSSTSTSSTSTSSTSTSSTSTSSTSTSSTSTSSTSTSSTSTSSTSTSSTSTSSTSTSSTSTSSTSTSSIGTTSTTGVATTTTTSGTTTTTLPQTDISKVVVQKSTNIIVSSGSTVAPDPGNTTQDKEQKTSRSNDVIVRENESGASKNEVAKKLYCN